MKVRTGFPRQGKEEDIYIPFVHQQTRANIRIHDVRISNVMVYRHSQSRANAFRCHDLPLRMMYMG